MYKLSEDLSWWFWIHFKPLKRIASPLWIMGFYHSEIWQFQGSGCSQGIQYHYIIRDYQNGLVWHELYKVGRLDLKLKYSFFLRIWPFSENIIIPRIPSILFWSKFLTSIRFLYYKSLQNTINFTKLFLKYCNKV